MQDFLMSLLNCFYSIGSFIYIFFSRNQGHQPGAQEEQQEAAGPEQIKYEEISKILNALNKANKENDSNIIYNKLKELEHYPPTLTDKNLKILLNNTIKNYDLNKNSPEYNAKNDFKLIVYLLKNNISNDIQHSETIINLTLEHFKPKHCKLLDPLINSNTKFKTTGVKKLIQALESLKQKLDTTKPSAYEWNITKLNYNSTNALHTRISTIINLKNKLIFKKNKTELEKPYKTKPAKLNHKLLKISREKLQDLIKLNSRIQEVEDEHKYDEKSNNSNSSGVTSNHQHHQTAPDEKVTQNGEAPDSFYQEYPSHTKPIV
jgi:hypothetical protein